MTGTVHLDNDAEREFDYWVWYFGPDLVDYEMWGKIRMTQPLGKVRWQQPVIHMGISIKLLVHIKYTTM